jgi:hypothetical protein
LFVFAFSFPSLQLLAVLPFLHTSFAYCLLGTLSSSSSDKGGCKYLSGIIIWPFYTILPSRIKTDISQVLDRNCLSTTGILRIE